MTPSSPSPRFKKIKNDSAGDGSGQIDTYELELRPGHTITRVDHTSRLGAGRKGRAASVDVHRTLTCTCGGHLGFGGLTVAEDLAHLTHFESEAERVDYETRMNDLRESILKQLGTGS